MWVFCAPNHWRCPQCLYAQPRNPYLHIISSTNARGNVFEPPKPIQNCPAADQVEAAQYSRTTVAYADNPKSVCEQLGRVNLTAPPTQITIDVSKKSCSHSLQKL